MKGVDEAERRRQQARRQEGVEREAHERHRRGAGQRVAPLLIALGEPAKQPEQRGDGDEEVERAVEEVPELDEAVVIEERLLHRTLVEDVQRALDVDEGAGVAERMGLRNRGGALQVPHDRVHGVNARM